MAGTGSPRPLRGQSFYLDLPSGRSARDLAEAIGRLGGMCHPLLGHLSQLGILKSENPVLPADSYSSLQLLCYLEITLDFGHPSGSCHTPSWPSLCEVRSSGSGALIPLASVEILTYTTATVCEGSNI